VVPENISCNIGSSADNTAIQRGKTNTSDLNYGSTIINVTFSINISPNGNRWANPFLTAGLVRLKIVNLGNDMRRCADNVPSA
jgi:hypothetical protein